MPLSGFNNHRPEISLPVRIGCSLVLYLLAGQTSAGELLGIDVDETDNVYGMQVEMILDAPAGQVYEVLTDFLHLYRLSPYITESKVLPSADPHTIRVMTRMEHCLLFYCVDFVRVEQVHTDGAERLTAEIMPQLSDFTSGVAKWTIQPDGDRTRVVYEAQMKPGFVLPPVLGPIFMKMEMRREILISLDNIECIARMNAARSRRPADREPEHDERCTTD